MKRISKTLFWQTIFIIFLFAATGSASEVLNCDYDGTQASGSEYCVVMPDEVPYNGRLVIWAHGFQDAESQLGGFPFENRWRWYSGSANDLRLNWRVKRFRADPDAVSEMEANYATSGYLERTLITMHTREDQQVPYIHEVMYMLKTIGRGSFLTDHLNIPIERYGHCQFTVEEALAGFVLMLMHSGDLQMLSGIGSFLQGDQLKAFGSIAEQKEIPFWVEGTRLKTIAK